MQNPEESTKPSVKEYKVDLNECGPMVLDALIYIKFSNDSFAHVSSFLP